VARPSMSPKNRSQKAEGIPSRKMIPPRIQLACFRLQPCSSIEKRRRREKGSNLLLTVNRQTSLTVRQSEFHRGQHM